MRRVLFFFAVLLFSLSPAFSLTMFVAVEAAEVRSSAGFFARDVGTLPHGAEVTVVRDSGRWSEIRAGNLAGWVVSASLSPRRTARPGSAVTPGEVALAGKGFGREVEIEYRRGGPDFSPVDEMESLVIPMAELRRFIIEGRLAGGEQ
ncbi:MAG: SH3 domain-containing protein [Treponema sp.]|nr:SH3 domain-containing protein [Treponema sp.]